MIFFIWSDFFLIITQLTEKKIHDFTAKQNLHDVTIFLYTSYIFHGRGAWSTMHPPAATASSWAWASAVAAVVAGWAMRGMAGMGSRLPRAPQPGISSAALIGAQSRGGGVVGLVALGLASLGGAASNAVLRSVSRESLCCLERGEQPVDTPPPSCHPPGGGCTQRSGAPPPPPAHHQYRHRVIGQFTKGRWRLTLGPLMLVRPELNMDTRWSF